MEGNEKEKAIRIYKTIKRNKSILTDPGRTLTERQRDQLTRDNAILMEELNRITRFNGKKTR